MTRNIILAAFAVLAICTPALAQDGPMVRAGVTTKISDHVHIIPDNSTPGVPNVGFVVGANATLVIDTGMGAQNGQTVLAEAQKLKPSNRLYLVTTHVHPEHDLGAQAFPAATTLIRASAQVREIAEDGMRTADIFRGRSETNKRLLDGAQFRPADLTFDGEHTLDLGGVSVRILALGPGHTQGDTATYVEGDNVLFSGDLAMRALPAFASPKSSLGNWLAALDKLETLKARTLVPSHGPVGDPAYIAAYRAYLTRIRDRTAVLKREGKTLEQATETISAELKADYPDISRAAGAIRAAYAEAP
jgi:glyoxylase-like metal-dependent hydrolase (beta-lactamase superfamily II)